MAFYQKRGEIPPKKHIAFYKADKTSLYREELVSSNGFSGVYSTKYHQNTPTRTIKVEELVARPDPVWAEAPLQYYHFLTNSLEKRGDFLSARKVLLKNDHVSVSTARVSENTTEFYENAADHELVFVHEGEGAFRCDYGRLDLKRGDYLVVPKGTIGQYHFDADQEVKLLVVESSAPFEIPGHFRNEHGQLLEHAPYSERDFRAPEFLEPIDEEGEFPLRIKSGGRFFQYTLADHPFDLVGWDGFHYPYVFNINDYSPIVGKIHQPPPVHVVFSNPDFVVCNFTPRLLDFHELAIPAPYYHSNRDCDEVLYYVSGEFTSRKGIEEGSITLHPAGIPHGPQPGKTEASIGKKSTNEVAVMIDTFTPLSLTSEARGIMVENYAQSWLL